MIPTPKEKAVELVGKYKEFTEDTFAERDYQAKQCALILVEEMLSVDPSIISDESYFPYWEEVKKEITKL